MTSYNVRKTVVVMAIMLLLSYCAHAQLVQNHALGFLVGTSQYNGDVNMTKAYYKPHFSLSLLYKMRLNNHYVARFSLSYIELKGFDQDFNNAYQQSRRYSFSDNNIYEGAALMEFNFLEFAYAEKKYRSEKRERFFSPYVVAGIALFYADQSEINDIFAIPMGVGLKYRVSPRVELNVEWVFRKTFTDNLDLLNTSVPYYDLYKQAWFRQTKDWYSTLGVTAVFVFKKKPENCPFYTKNRYEDFKKKNNNRRKK
ncbi:MAG: DUF6089 family protein [Bacteroidales bacterium]|jgi:hypothetical protein|nr:DUF6089 family protein [Bacteroidales bacterium]